MIPKKQIKRATPSLCLIPFVIACFAFLPQVHAVSPPPDGGYPGGNTAEGQSALLSLTTGGFNTAVGFFSLRGDAIGSFNTGVGAGALLANTMGEENTAIGLGALLSNTDGFQNTATGAFALFFNTGMGTGIQNTADGDRALFSNTTGGGNTATGFQALGSNIDGNLNTAHGDRALFSNTHGTHNTALGFQAGLSQDTGSGNVYIGAGVGAVAGENDHTYIRNINATSVSGGGADFVTVDLTTGLLGHLSSSQRYKEDIKPMDNASQALFALKPVTFRYKKEIDQSQSLDYGLIAEDVAQVDPNLAIRDGKGQIESVRYNAINAMLLNEFLKEHRKVQDQERRIQQQEATIAQLETKVETLVAHAKEQDSKIQTVSDQVTMNKAAPQLTINNP